MRISTVVVPTVILLLCVAAGYGDSYSNQYGGYGDSSNIQYGGYGDSYSNQYGGYEVSYSNQFGGYGAESNLYSGGQYGGQGYGIYAPISLPPVPPRVSLYRDRVLILLALLLLPILGSTNFG